MALTATQERLLKNYDPALQEAGLYDVIANIEAGVPTDGGVTNTKLATDVKVGSLASLTTTAKSSVVAAVNEVDGHADSANTAVGTLGSLTTSVQTDLVSAINEVDAHADAALAGQGILVDVAIKTQADSPVAVTAAMSGKTFSNKGASGSVTFNLPTAAAGLNYTFHKVVAGQDIVLQANTGDTVGGSAAGKKFKNVTDAGRCKIVAIDATDWDVVFSSGTWAVDNA